MSMLPHAATPSSVLPPGAIEILGRVADASLADAWRFLVRALCNLQVSRNDVAFHPDAQSTFFCALDYILRCNSFGSGDVCDALLLGCAGSVN